MTPNNSLSSLEIGKTLKNTFVLYRSHLKLYLGIALRSQLWYLGVFFVILGFTVLTALLIAILGSISGEGSSLNWIQSVFVFFLMMGLLVALFYGCFFCVGKSLMNLALISRLAYGELASKPETPQAARQQINTQHWKFFGVQFLVGLILFGINMGLQILQTFIVLPASLILGPESTMAAIVTLVLALASSILYFWFYAHWFIPEVPLAVENNLSISSAVERSWNLSKRNVMQILLIILVASLMTIPLYLIVLSLALAPFIPTLLIVIQSEDWSTLVTQTPLMISLGFAFLITIFLSIVISFLIVPFWQAMKGVIYYQLRSQVET